MDHYKTLGVDKNATPDEIKRAYRKLAGQHHPDKGGDTNTFQQIQIAYDTLSDPEKRRQYDNPMPQGFQGFNNGFHFSTNHFDLNEIFGQMFGQHPHHGQRNQTYRTSVTITLENAYYGVSHTLKLNTPNGPKALSIEIPKGIQNGNQMKYDKVFDNQGSLIVEFRIVPHLKFERKQNDLISSIQVSVLDLIVGGKIEFSTISGKNLEVAIPPKTQPNMQLKIAGQGMPIINSQSYGDQILLIKPFIPAIIDPRITDSILQSKS